jgi:predicted DNA-binding transcriptional regulator AlpA
MGRLLPLQDAAREYSVGATTIYRLIRDKRIGKFRRTGDRRTFVDEAELREALGFRRVENEEE